MSSLEFNPDYGVSPGEVLQEALDEIGMTQAELADRTGRPTKTVNEIIQGKTSITAETALQLERVLNIPAKFWIRLESLYQEHRVREKEELELEKYSDWLKRLPINAMVKEGWISKKDNPVHQVKELLNFYGVANPMVWQERWKAAEIYYRTSSLENIDLGAVSAWLRQGELFAQRIPCEPFSKDKFLACLTNIRKLTNLAQTEFEPRIVEECAKAGVAVVFISPIRHAPVSGATRWLSSSKACIQLSYRHKTDDHFWFTLFHEAGHILLHSKKEVFIDVDDESTNVKEEQANDFANQVLFPPKSFQKFLHTRDFSEEAITKYSAQVELAPGILVGRLQRHRLIPYESRLNKLKRTFSCLTK